MKEKWSSSADTAQQGKKMQEEAHDCRRREPYQETKLLICRYARDLARPGWKEVVELFIPAPQVLRGRHQKRVAASLFKPKKRPAVIVLPNCDTPGIEEPQCEADAYCFVES